MTTLATEPTAVFVDDAELVVEHLQDPPHLQDWVLGDWATTG